MTTTHGSYDDSFEKVYMSEHRYNAIDTHAARRKFSIHNVYGVFVQQNGPTHFLTTRCELDFNTMYNDSCLYQNISLRAFHII